jgi:hypothetical protein
MKKENTDSLMTYARSFRCRVSAAVVAALHVINLTFVPAGAAEVLPSGDVARFFTNVPLEVARVQDSYFSNAAASPCVVIVQNAHANYEAQKNIGKIIAYYQNTHAVDSVCLEGSVGAIDTSFFRAFPLEEKKRAIIDSYVKAGRISGPEEQAIIAPEPLELFGVEDEALYVAHIQAYVEINNRQDEIERFLTDLSIVAGDVQTARLSPELNAFLRAQRLCADGETDFFEYGPLLIHAAARAKIDLSRFEAFKRLQEIAIFQTKIDQERLILETERLIKEDLLQRDISREDLESLAYHDLDFKAARMSPIEYYSFIKKITARYGIDLRRYEQVNRYYHYLRVAEELDSAALFEESKQLEDAIIARLCRNKEEKEIVYFLRFARVLERLLRLKAVPDDVALFQSQRARFSRERIDVLIRHYAAREIDSTILDIVPHCEGFYKYAHARERHIVENTLAYLEASQKKKTLLTVGGYHSPGITAALKKKQVSYVVVAPRLTRVPENDLYQQIMSGYDALFGIREGSRGGTVEKFSELSFLPLSQINAPLVNTLLTEIRREFVDEIVHIGRRAGSEPLSAYYRQWNKKVKDWTIVEYSADGEAFFIHTDTLRKALRARPFQLVQALIEEFGLIEAPHRATTDAGHDTEYVYVPSEDDLIFFQEKAAAYDLEKTQIKAAISRREAITYMQSYGFGTDGIFKTHEDQRALIQQDLRHLIKEKKKKSEYLIRVYEIGLGEYPKEIVELLKAFNEVLVEVEGPEAARWRIHLIGIDVNKEAIAAAHEVFKAYHDGDFQVFFKHNSGAYAPYFTKPLQVQVRSDFFQADTLDGQRLSAIGRTSKADYIVNRYGPSDNAGVAGGGISHDTVKTYKLGKIVNAYFSLYNLVSALAKEETRYITEPVNLFTIGSIAMKPEKDIPVLRFAGAELLTARKIRARGQAVENTEARPPVDSLINRGTGIYKILYPAFITQSDLKGFFDLIEKQHDISLNPRVRALIPEEVAKIQHRIKHPNDLGPISPYAEETSLARRDEATGLKPQLNPVIIENLKRGEMLVFKRLEMNRLIDTIAAYLQTPTDERKEKIINMMIYGIHLKAGEPDYRKKFADWFRDVEENRLEQYFNALLFIRDLLAKNPPLDVLEDFSITESAFSLLQFADTRYMIVPSFLEAGALGHIGQGGIYLSLQAITKALEDTEEGRTYNGIDVGTIIYALLLHEASDYARGAHTDNITPDIFKAIDLFWSSLNTEEHKKPARIISLQEKRKALTRHIRASTPFFAFETALVTEAYLKMHSRLVSGEDDYSVYADLAARGYIGALRAPVLDKDSFGLLKEDLSARFQRLQRYFPQLRGFSLHLVCGLDRPSQIDPSKKTAFVDMRSPRYFFECVVIDQLISADKKGAHAHSRREVDSIKTQAEFLSRRMSARELRDYFTEIKTEFEFDGSSIFALLEEICFKKSTDIDRYICAWGATQTELYSPAVIEGFKALMRPEERLLPAKERLKGKTPLRAGDPKFRTAKAARKYFYERAVKKLTWLYPEITPFEKEALRALLIYKSDFHAQARTDMLFLAVMSGLLTINDAEILLAIGPERKSSVEDHLELFGLEAVYKNVQRQIEVMSAKDLSNETILELLSDGISYAMIKEYAERKTRTVEYILDLSRKQGFRATEILDAVHTDYEWEEPVLIVTYSNGKKEAYVTFRGVKYSFSVNDESRYFKSLDAGKIVFKANKERIIIEDELHEKSWTFDFKDINGRLLLCDTAGVPIGKDIYYETLPQKKHATNVQITHFIPEWASPSDEEKCAKKIALLGSFAGESTRKACLKRLNAILSFMDKSPDLPSRLEDQLFYIAAALGNPALAHYFKTPRTKIESNDACANFYSEKSVGFKEDLIREFVKNYYTTGKDSRHALEKTMHAREDIAAYGDELFITLFGHRGEDLDALAVRLERLIFLMEQNGLEYSGATALELHKDKKIQEIERSKAEPRAAAKVMAFYHYEDQSSTGSAALPRILMVEIDADSTLQPHPLSRFPNKQTVRNELKQRRRNGTDFIDILKKPHTAGGDIGLYKACLAYGIPLRSRGRSRQYQTVREALEALLLVDRDKRYATELKKSDSHGGNSWLKVCCDRMGIPLPVNSLEKYPTKESAIDGYRILKEMYPDKRITATFMREHDPSLLQALRRECVPYDMGIRRGEYQSIDDIYEALMAIPAEERTIALLNRNTQEGGNRHLLNQYYKNRVALHKRGCFLTRAPRERKYPDKETAQKKVAWYRRHYGQCSAKMLQQKSAAGGDITLLIACREFDITLDRATRTSRLATDGYARYKEEVFELRDALQDEDIGLLWYMMRDGDEEARAKYIAYFLPVVIDSVEGSYSAHARVSAESAYERDDKIGRGNLSIVTATGGESDFEGVEFARMYKGEEKALAFAYLLSNFIPLGTEIFEFDSSDWQDVPEWLNRIIETDVPYRVMSNYEILPSADKIAIKEELGVIIHELTGRTLDLEKYTPLERASIITVLGDEASHLSPTEQKRLKRLILESYFPRLCPQSAGEWLPGRKQGLEEFMRERIRAAIHRSDMYPFGDKKVTDQFSKPSGNSRAGSGNAGRQRTLEDRLGTEDGDPLERLEHMKTRLLQIRRGDYSFLWDSEFTLDQSVLFSQDEKEAFKTDLLAFFREKEIFKGFDFPFGLWLVGSLGHIGLARKEASDINLMIVADAPEKKLSDMLTVVSQRLGGTAVYKTDQGSLLFHIGRGDDWAETRATDPDFVRLCQSHDLGRPSSLATIEAVSTYGHVAPETVALNRARFHIDEVLCEVGENARFVLESDPGDSVRVSSSLVKKLSTDARTYEYFMAEYLLHFFAKQVLRLNEYSSQNQEARRSSERKKQNVLSPRENGALLERVIEESLAKNPEYLDRGLLGQLIATVTAEKVSGSDVLLEKLRQQNEYIAAAAGETKSALILSKEFIDMLEAASEEEKERLIKIMRHRAFSFERIVVVCDNRSFTAGAAQSLDAAMAQINRVCKTVFGVPAGSVDSILFDAASEYTDVSFLSRDVLEYERIVLIAGSGDSPFDEVIKKMARRNINNRFRIIDHGEAVRAVEAAAVMRTIDSLFTKDSSPARRVLTGEAWIKLGYFYATHAGFDALRTVSERLISTGMITPVYTAELEGRLSEIGRLSIIRTAA